MKLDEADQAKLLKIFEKGIAKSTEKLVQLSGKPWNIHVISLDVGTGARFLSILARDVKEYLGVIFANPGEKYLVLFSEESGRALLNSPASGRDPKRPLPPGLEQSALAEMANVFINGLSGALADRHGMVRVISAPTVAHGRKAALYGLAFGAVLGEEAIVDVLIHVSSPELAADCTVMFRLDVTSANFLLHTDPDALSAYLPAATEP